jgi:hypothetical protein
MAGQLVCRTADTLPTFGGFCIGLVEEQSLPVFVELFLGELRMHEMSQTLHTFDSGKASVMGQCGCDVSYLSGSETRLSLLIGWCQQ